MSGKFISFIVAASIAVTGMTAAPAQASDRDLARALAAIAGVAIIGAAVHDSRKDKRHAAPSRYRSKKSYRAAPRRAYQQPYAYQQRRPAVERAYRQGVRDQRRVERRHGHGQQRGYSARPFGY
ncbi:hypothetical protein [Roseovarius arcticus]|uniref:hypothetical protein n=1 Tax=Roseovarius arcticus TaxID=2547404 RepID=UPI00111050CC|nr:hypothetical protein [Roseovarius arcticus]